MPNLMDGVLQTRACRMAAISLPRAPEQQDAGFQVRTDPILRCNMPRVAHVSLFLSRDGGVIERSCLSHLCNMTFHCPKPAIAQNYHDCVIDCFIGT
ncbi:hypothetical protein AiwAL_05205 [Acidiphilium sp. AL]|uniref:hypothetical protein n=1 Tax=Acidiphilium sp. AL TaxID=2871704 RepID=UPI0021CB32A2|nr:hypothetical protein [Acidiphilium sp. AL]MCU4159501.1 hypothetical protein [Acidiphilium sp. AL]